MGASRCKEDLEIDTIWAKLVAAKWPGIGRISPHTSCDHTFGRRFVASGRRSRGHSQVRLGPLLTPRVNRRSRHAHSAYRVTGGRRGRDDRGNGGRDRAVRVWSIDDRKLLRTIWIPSGPENVGNVFAVALSPDKLTIAVGGVTQRLLGQHPIYLFDRASGSLIRRIETDTGDIPDFVKFSPDGRFLAALIGTEGLQVFDREMGWKKVFEDRVYGDGGQGLTFSSGGRLATTSLDGRIRLYAYSPNGGNNSDFHLLRVSVTQSGKRPLRIAFSPDGGRLAVGYLDVIAVDIMDGDLLAVLSTLKPDHVTRPNDAGLSKVAWSVTARPCMRRAVYKRPPAATALRDLFFSSDGAAAALGRNADLVTAATISPLILTCYLKDKSSSAHLNPAQA